MPSHDNRPNPGPTPEAQPSIWTTWSSFRLVGLFFALLIGDFFFQILIYEAVGGWFVAALGGGVLGILLPLAVLQRLSVLDLAADLRLQAPDGVTLALAGLFAAASLVPTSLLAEVSLRLHPADPEWVEQLRANLPTSAAGYVVAFATAGLVGPLVEEVLFRGLLQRLAQRSWGPAAGVVISSLVFGIIHGEPWFLFGLIGIGLVLAYVFLVTRSLWACWLAHALHNTLSLGLMLAVGDPPAEPTPVTVADGIWLAVSMLALALLGRLLWRRRPGMPDDRTLT